MAPTLLLTLDLEEDGAGIADVLAYECAEQAGQLTALLRSHGVKLTTFVSGRVLDERPDLVELFDRDLTVFENHGYDHGAVRRVPTRSPLDNVVAGHEAYRRFFGHDPRGYRAPNGMIARPELEKLREFGYRYDSSIFPTRFPGRFDWSAAPSTDFLWQDIDLLECPISVTRRFKIPAGVSYMQLVGWPLYRRLLASGGWPERLVVDLHLHDIFPGSWYQSLPRHHRIAYWRARRERPMIRTLQRLLTTCERAGYQTAWLSDHAESVLTAGELPRVAVP